MPTHERIKATKRSPRSVSGPIITRAGPTGTASAIALQSTILATMAADFSGSRQYSRANYKCLLESPALLRGGGTAPGGSAPSIRCRRSAQVRTITVVLDASPDRFLCPSQSISRGNPSAPPVIRSIMLPSGNTSPAVATARELAENSVLRCLQVELLVRMMFHVFLHGF